MSAHRLPNDLKEVKETLSFQIGNREKGEGVILIYGETVPTDGDSGYAPGCLFVKTSATPGLYVNQGTYASCDFDAASIA